MHEVWLFLLALSDSCRRVKYIQGKALHHLTEDPMAVRPLTLNIPAAQRIPGGKTGDRLIAPT